MREKQQRLLGSHSAYVEFTDIGDINTEETERPRTFSQMSDQAPNQHHALKVWSRNLQNFAADSRSALARKERSVSAVASNSLDWQPVPD